MQRQLAWFRKDKWEQLFRSFIWFWSWLQCHKPCYVCISECTKIKNEQSLFKNIFRTKYWCVSVVYVKKNLIIKQKSFGKCVSFYFFSNFLFSFYGMGFCSVLFVLCSVAVYISLWRNRYLVWHLLFTVLFLSSAGGTCSLYFPLYSCILQFL